ncbi:HNH endonuclease signature motif containing protein [Listeria innocua]|uniref:HNH endonuclease signature motif containing protein n=1 Tax=Listeria innocua TaxID=1642 RepID=UPI00162399D7|nr:HNH endonuclease signature motif containing protein [Listeria innocua]MBC1385430.1 HNH endonuclease [Listeria innocua]HAC4846978.1 hypothetical protein [Listeria monocytogenes]
MDKLKTNKTLRHMEYYDMTEKFDELYAQSMDNHVFTDLMCLVSETNNIKLAFRNIKKLIHKKLDFNPSILMGMMESTNIRRSVEYTDNRISKYASQRGKCAVLGIYLDIFDIHCHHIVPVFLGGSDKYQNLIIVHQDIHRLIHAKNDSTISFYLNKFKLSQAQIEKINQLRTKVKNSVLLVE